MRKYNAYKQPAFAAVIRYIAYGSASFLTILQPPGHKDLYHERVYQATIAQVQTGVEILFHPKRRLRHRGPRRQTLPVSDSMYRCPHAWWTWLYWNSVLFQSTDSLIRRGCLQRNRPRWSGKPFSARRHKFVKIVKKAYICSSERSSNRPVMKSGVR